MKNNLIFLISVIFSIYFGIETFAQNSYQIECVSANNEQITLLIWDVKKASSYKLKQAQKDAIRAVLFNGVSQTKNCVGQKPLLLSTEDKENFKKIDLTFFAKKGTWMNFVRNADSSYSEKKVIDNKNCMVYKVTVTKSNLRRYLEDKEIIKPLNSIF